MRERAITEAPHPTWAIALLLFLPSFAVWAVTFPGFLQADHQNTIAGIAIGKLSEWHSLVWGYLSFPFLYLAPSIAIYGIVQITVFTIATTFSISRLTSLLALKKRTSLTLTLIFAFVPTFLLYNQLYSSDVIFAILLLPLTVLLIEITQTHGEALSRPSFAVALAVLLYFEFELRKNAILIAIFTLIVLFVTLKKYRRTLAAIAVTCLIAISSTTFLFSNILRATPSPPQELLAVPVQQVARAYVDNGNIPEEANKFFTRFHDEEYWRSQYIPHNSDPMKFQFEKGREELSLSGDFIKNWLAIGLENPRSYVKAYLDLMGPFWQLTANPSSQYIDTDFMNHDVYSQTACKEQCSEHYIEQFEGVSSYGQDLATHAYTLVNKAQIPIITDLSNLIFFNRALPLWLYVAGWVIAIRIGRKRDYFVVSLPIFCILASLLAFSPVPAFRYSLQMYYLAPALTLWLLTLLRIKTRGTTLPSSESR